MTKILDFADYLIVALLIALCGYVAWKAYCSKRTRAQASAVFRLATASAATVGQATPGFAIGR